MDGDIHAARIKSLLKNVSRHPGFIFLENVWYPRNRENKLMTLVPFRKRFLVREKILGFGSQVTGGEGFVEKHPARPGPARSLLICGNFWKVL